MSLIMIIEVKNRLVSARRFIDIYHHHTGIADSIYCNQSISLSLRELTGNRQRDYLQISVAEEVAGSQFFYHIDLPSWAHFQVNLKGKPDIFLRHVGNRHILKLFLSQDSWQMKIFRPLGTHFSTADFVTILDTWP
ncbi:MAG: hypothetical protein MUF15_19855 [Acidobacteria bacterium]|jgi:hypothetical protein|nr:hypothetical protein [Acidobacteriota bacterium]